MTNMVLAPLSEYSMGQKKCIEGIFMGETLNFHYFDVYSFTKELHRAKFYR